MSNPVQQAVDFLLGAGEGRQRVIAIRTTGDGHYSVKMYRDGASQGEVNIGGKRDLVEALTSLTEHPRRIINDHPKGTLAQADPEAIPQEV